MLLILDIDECANASLNNCQQVCVNSDGGYTCDCLPGYSLTNSTHCEGISWPGCNYLQVFIGLLYSDVNECAELNGGCHQVCINVEGSFLCSCNDGYELHSDNITCTGE